MKQTEVLKLMYSKYGHNPAYIYKLISRLEPRDNASKIINIAQDHFDGIGATQKCIDKIRIGECDEVLDIGSGFGGVSMMIAHKAKAHVTGIEIDKERFDCAIQLTKMVGLSGKVDFICADFDDVNLEEKHYSKIVSMLAILHFINKEKALQKIGKLLANDGMVYIEDYCINDSKAYEGNRNKLLQTVSCPYLLTNDKYLNTLEAGGLQIIKLEDITDSWKQCCANRVTNEKNKLSNSIELIGKEKAENHLKFCQDIAYLFDDNVIKGVRIIATKK